MTAKTGLDIMGLPTLFQSIANDRKVGTLKVENEAGSKYLYFKNGHIIQITSSQKPSILAEGLRRHPELEEASYKAVCEEQRKTGKSLASILLGEEDGKALVVAICQFQILEEVCELMTWNNCHSEFVEGNPDPMLFDLELMDIEPVDVGMVLLEGARRTDEWKLILQVLTSKKDVPHKVGKVGSDLAAAEKTILSAMDGFRDIEDILDTVRLSSFEAMTTLAGLIKKGVVALKTDKELMQMARLDVFRENLSKRVRLYERAIELGEKNKEITSWLARAYETMGMRDKAAQQYSKVGYATMASDAFSDAIAAFEKCVQLNPESFDAHERLVTLLAKTNRMEEAAAKATTFARWLSIQGDRNRAILILKENTEKAPAQLENLDLLGSLYQECGYRADAVQVYRSLAQQQLAKQDFAGAAKTYHKMLLIEPDNFETRKAFAEVLEKRGKQVEARDHYRVMGKAIYSMGIWEDKKLLEYLTFAGQKLIDNDPKDLMARKWLAEAYLAQNDKDRATEQLKEILSHVDDQQNLSLLVDTLKILVTLHPQEIESRFKLAETYLKMKREREAIQEFFALGIKAAEMGKTDKALEAFDRLLSSDPSNSAIRLKKAEILIQQQKNDKAIEELLLTGYLSIGADKLWQAIKAFRQILTLHAGHTQCYLELGKLYERLNKSREAVAAYKKHIQKAVKANDFGLALGSCLAILRLDQQNSWAQTARQKLYEMAPQLPR